MQKSAPKSIKADELRDIAEQAARDILGDRMEDWGSKVTIGRWPIGTIGIIWHGPELDRFSTNEIVEISEKMVSVMKPVVGEVSPVAILSKDFGTVGFFPNTPIDLKEF